MFACPINKKGVWLVRLVVVGVTRTAMARRLLVLRDDRQLARFVIEGRATGKQLGTGSYGSVEEVKTCRNPDQDSSCNF